MFKALLHIWADAQGHWFSNDDGRQGDFERYHYMRVKPCPSCHGDKEHMLGATMEGPKLQKCGYCKGIGQVIDTERG